MKYEYVKEKIIKEKSEKEKRIELIISIIRTRNDLKNAIQNYEFAEGQLIDYFLYEIKANQAKLDYLLNYAKEQEVHLDLINSAVIKEKYIV